MEQTEKLPITETGPDPTIDSAATSAGTDQDVYPHDSAPKALSKSAMKKAARAERYAATKLERRAKEKEMKKGKKRLRAEKRAAGELNDDEENRRKKRSRLQFGGKVVVDLGFDQLMSEKVGMYIIIILRVHDTPRK
jgi:tRNA (guanine9-N1)-methyltransferase